MRHRRLILLLSIGFALISAVLLYLNIILWLGACLATMSVFYFMRGFVREYHYYKDMKEWLTENSGAVIFVASTKDEETIKWFDKEIKTRLSRNSFFVHKRGILLNGNVPLHIFRELNELHKMKPLPLVVRIKTDGLEVLELQNQINEIRGNKNKTIELSRMIEN